MTREEEFANGPGLEAYRFMADYPAYRNSDVPFLLERAVDAAMGVRPDLVAAVGVDAAPDVILQGLENEVPAVREVRL